MGRNLAVLGCGVGGGGKEGQLLKVKRGKSREDVGGVGRELGWKLERSQKLGLGVGEIMEKTTWSSPLPLRVLGTVLSHSSLTLPCLVSSFFLDFEQRRREAISPLPGFPNVSQLHSQSVEDILSSTQGSPSEPSPGL